MCLLAHNTAFDAAILSWHFGIKPKFLLDTLSMARPTHGLTVGGSLAALVSYYGLGTKGTDAIESDGLRRADFDEWRLAHYGAYCDNDVEITYRLFKKLARGFPQQELRVIDILLRMFTEPCIVLDTACLSDHLRDVRERRARLLAAVEADKTIINSNPKFAQALRDLGVEPPMKWSEKQEKMTYAFAKTDVAFQELLEYPDERVQALVAARLGTKGTIEETRTLAFLGIAVRGTLPILLNYYGGHTGRASGGDGINLQNLPAERNGNEGKMRKSLTAPPGYVFVSGDSSQIEARVVAWLADQTELVMAFSEGVDIYSLFATDVYGYAVNKYTAPDERQVGKIAILGLGFGMGHEKFQRTIKTLTGIDLDIGECKRIVDFYRAKYSKIKALWRKCDEALAFMCSGAAGKFYIAKGVYAEGTRIYLPNGLFLNYPNLQFNGKEYTYTQRKITKYVYGAKIVENIVQALARIIVFDQMLLINAKYKVVLTVHDENCAIAPEGAAVEAEQYVRECMKVIPAWASGLPVTCEAGSHKSYGAIRKK